MLSGHSPSCPIPSRPLPPLCSHPDFRLAHHTGCSKDSGCSHLGSECCFLPASQKN